MQIGKATAPVSHICQAYPDRVEVRGRDLCGDVMGRLSFSEYFYLLLTGDEPTDDQRYFLDLVLVAIAEHGMMPTNVAARMTLAADPDSLQGAVAAGILGCGPVILGTAEVCARLLDEAQARVAAGGEPRGGRRRDGRARSTPQASGRRGSAIRCTGRSTRAPSASSSSPTRAASAARTSLLARDFRDAVAEAWGKPLTMNVSMPIAAVMLDLGFPAASVKAIPVLARTAGLLAHLAEEQQQPIGFLMAGKAEEAISYEPPAGAAPMMLAPEVEALPWAEQLAIDDAAYREQIAYLFERSAFYREKLAAAGFGSAAALRAAWPTSRALPLTDKRELRERCTPENPIGEHLCADARRDRPRLLDQRHDRHAELHPADRRAISTTGSRPRRGATRPPASTPGERIVSTYNAGPFVAGAALAVVRPHRALPHPGRHRQHASA